MGQVSYEYYHPEDIQKMVQLHNDGMCVRGEGGDGESVCVVRGDGESVCVVRGGCVFVLLRRCKGVGWGCMCAWNTVHTWKAKRLLEGW